MKKPIKIMIDILMTLLLLVLMAYQYFGMVFHEITGATMLLLFIIHHILNYKWYIGLFRGKYNRVRVHFTLVDIALLINIILLMISGITMSQFVFADTNLGMTVAIAREVHLITSYTGFLLMGLHIGLHWRNITNVLPGKNYKLVVWIYRVLAAAIASYGVVAMINRKIFDYIFLKSQFVFFDFNEPIMNYYLDFLAIMGICIWISYYIIKIISMRRKKE